MPPDLARRHHTSTTPSSATTQHLTMKTASGRAVLGSPYAHPHHQHHSRHSQSNSHSCRANLSTTPLASPRPPHSVGQQYPPKLSPGTPNNNIRSPSPNYFGLAVDSAHEGRDSNSLPHDHWSSPSSSIKSFGAVLPKQLPLDANPDFEAFKRQADANRGKSFSFGTSQLAPQPALGRPKLPPRCSTNDSVQDLLYARASKKTSRELTQHRSEADNDSLHDSAYVSSDSKRNSETSLNTPAYGSLPRFESPAQSDSRFELLRRTTWSKSDNNQQRLSLTLESGQGLMTPSNLKDILEHAPDQDLLILDVRVASQYATSRIRGALNLCIPTTLLKRPAFDLNKLQKTLQLQEDQEKFSQWGKAKYLVVYDGSASEKRDAPSAVNMLKKFTDAGFSGESCMLRGGFNQFASSFPTLIDRRTGAERAGTSAPASGGGAPTFAPVIGGVTLPATANDPNPFFNNIRQNMDLADGVGQLDIAVPPSMDIHSLPPWLCETLEPTDHGKKVSSRFLEIEKNEQKRMKAAYSVLNPATGQASDMGNVQLSGVEKGGKNRYKDILPFEHARVHLPEKKHDECDYVNASHVKASRSNKRYIASQGPLPTTFNDFWSMVWDQDVRVVVMLTAESEGGTLKCHSYWQNREFGPLKLRPLSEKKVSLDMGKHRSSSNMTPSSVNSASELGRRRANTTTTLDTGAAQQTPSQATSETPHVIIRKFALSHASHPFAPIREITHLHYPSWPDFGAPAQPSHLLALIELANVMQHAALPVDANAIAASAATHSQPTINWLDEPELEDNPRPMLVHCSAGCGRTGTFCTVDSVVDMLKRQRLSANTAFKQQRDADGDVAMEDEPLSPRTMRSRGSSPPKKIRTAEPNDNINLNAAWIGDGQQDLIAKTVEDFRSQRLSMVQSLRQYVLCYETVVEWISRINDKGSTVSKSGTKNRLRSGSLGVQR